MEKKGLSIPHQEKKPETSQKISFQDLLGSIDEKNITKKDNLGVEYVLSKQGNQYFAAIADGSGQAEPISTEELEKQFAYQEKQEKTVYNRGSKNVGR